MNPNSITVFFPACNDGGTIGSLVITALQVLPRITTDYEVIVVNDGSQDHTADVLEELSRRYPQVRVIHHARNRGYGRALRTGFAHASKEWVFYTDGDAQYDAHDLLLLTAAWQPDVDVVNGYKIARNDPLHRILIDGSINTASVSPWSSRAGRGLRLPPDQAQLARRRFTGIRERHNLREMVRKFQDRAVGLSRSRCPTTIAPTGRVSSSSSDGFLASPSTWPGCVETGRPTRSLRPLNRPDTSGCRNKRTPWFPTIVKP